MADDGKTTYIPEGYCVDGTLPEDNTCANLRHTYENIPNAVMSSSTSKAVLRKMTDGYITDGVHDEVDIAVASFFHTASGQTENNRNFEQTMHVGNLNPMHPVSNFNEAQLIKMKKAYNDEEENDFSPTTSEGSQLISDNNDSPNASYSLSHRSVTYRGKRSWENDSLASLNSLLSTYRCRSLDEYPSEEDARCSKRFSHYGPNTERRAANSETEYSSNRVPLFRRVSELLDRRLEHRRRRSDELLSEELSQAAFRPTIDAGSVKLWLKRFPDGDAPSVFERLSTRPQQKKLSLLHTQQISQLSESHTPSVPAPAPPTVQRAKLKNFMERLDADRIQRQQHLTRLANEMYPPLSKTESRDPQRSSAGLYNRGITRLNKTKTEGCMETTNLFRPQLNERSLRMEKHRTLHELIADSDRRAAEMKEQTLKEKEAKLKRQQSQVFVANKKKPFYIKKSTSLVNTEHKPITRDPKRLYDMEVIHEKLLRQEKQRETLRQQRDIEALMECTFSPVTNTKRFQAAPPVAVEGVQKYIQRAAMAKCLEQEKRRREEQIFGIYGRSTAYF